MESDASFPILSALLDAYPEQAGALYNTYADLTLSQQWRDIRLHDLAPAGFAVLFAHKTQDDPIRLILPLPFHAQSLTPATLRRVFKSLDSLEVVDLGIVSDGPLCGSGPTSAATTEPDFPSEQARSLEEVRAGETLDKETIYVSIVTTDSSTVYYKLTRGIKKPTDVPDE